ncbi:S-layer homology domain-containing protein [Fenollaria massiliensis]|uniref:S-layer homology domain-containing protein n=1 Tax=Fenollaria massiliensis TaxID=938288 RepID=UPI00036B4842|nr:S-layer homology domain-containing protein [Fenollaria massiliensis]
MKTKRIVSLVLVFLILLSTFSFDLKASDAVTNEEVIREDNEEKLSNETNEEEANSPVDESLSEEKEDESSEETSDDTVSFNDNWTYFEDGVDPSSDPEHNTWAFGQYNKDAAAAKTGQAPFGAKEGKEYVKDGFTTKTLLRHYLDDKKTVPTYFFVKKFNVDNTMSLSNKSLKFDLAYDDAVIVYLNRDVIYKANVPDAGYTQSVEYGCKEKVGKPKKVEVSIAFSDWQEKLTSGENYLAVELHQYSNKSSDIYFDMQNIRFEDEAQKATSENEFATPVLTIGSNPSERNFTWYNKVNATGYVEVKESGDSEGKIFTAEANENNRKKGFVNYKANIKGLKADTEYELVYWNGENSTKSEAVNFKTAKEGDFSFFLVGDPQIGAGGNKESDAQGWDKTLNIMKKRMTDEGTNFAFLLSAGDQINSYSSNEDEYVGFTERDGLKGMTLAPVIGNHDGENATRNGFFEHYTLPEFGNEGRADYAYVYNNTLFISLDSTYGVHQAEHSDFVKKTVEKYKNKVDWKVLTFHHAIYSVATHAVDKDILNRRQYIPKLVKDNGIDAVLMGHDHVYVRTHLMDGTEPLVKWENNVEGKAPNEYINPKGALYITANSGSGSKFYTIKDEKFDYAAVKNQERVPNYSEISVTDNTFKVVTYRTSDNSVVDEVTLKKEKENPNPEPNPNPQPEPNPEPNPDNDNTIIIPPYEPDTRDEHSYRPRRPRTDKTEENKEETKTIETNTKPIEKTKLSPIEVADKVLPVNFTDIVNEKRRDAIINLASRGVLAGIKKDKFMPNTTVTRAMVAAVFMRISIDKFINTSMSAKDITMKDWYFNSVKWAMTHGIVAGYSDGSFKPMKKVSRQELAVMLEGLLKLYNINMPNVVDVDYSAYSYLPAWSRDAVIDVVRKGLLELDQDGKLGYDKEVSRADFAYAIDKIVEFALNN